MKKIFTCIICPNGCEIEVELDKDKIINIEGATCKKGKEYVNQELTNPQRNISSSVKVVNGPLSGFIGTVQEINKEKNKVKVMVSMFGRETPVELEFSQVEKV